jgi:hypothetical protein
MFQPRFPVAATAGFLTAILAWESCALAQSASAGKKAPGSPPPHAHGVASLQLAVDGNLLTLEFQSPLDNLVGFERPPRNDKEKASVRRMAERLRKAETLFVPTPQAGCSPASVNLESPVIDASLLATDAGKPGTDSAKGGGRADKRASGKEDEGHAALTGEFVFRCERPANLRDMEVKLFDVFPQLKRLDVQVAAPGGQKAAKLSSENRRVSW